MDSSPNLTLPYIIAAQAQKHVTHNEAIRGLDAIVQLMVLDRDLASPPGSPSNGDRYIVAATPTDAWAGQTGNVAVWQDGVWTFYAPRAGWTAWVDDEAKLFIHDGSAWGEITVAVGSGALLWGINATADTTNRLALKSAASLFDNVGNGHQHKINKAAAGDTASLLFQTGYSGRAEFGLTGDDDFHVKVSPDGTTWYEALVVDRSSGAARLPATTYLDLPAASAPATPASGKVRLYAKTDKSLYQKDDAGTESGLAGGGSGGGTNPNLLINADGRIDQHLQGTAATTADDAYGSSDMWYSLTQTASITVQRLTDGEDGTPFYQQLKQTQASAQRMGRAQIVEGVNGKHARGQSLVLSGRIRCSASQAIRYAILEWTGTEDAPTSDVVNSWTNATFTAGQFFNSTTLNVLGVGSTTPSANTWTDLTALVATAGSSLKNLIVMIWTEGAAAQNVTLDIGKTKLEVAAAATAWQQTDRTVELAKCLRYYEVLSAATNGSGAYGVAQAASTSRAVCTISWKGRKRAAPTVTISADSDWAFYNTVIGSYVVWSSGHTFNGSEDGATLDVSTTTTGLGGAGTATAMTPNAATTAARIYADARL